MEHLKKREEIVVTIEKLAYGGSGVSRIGDRVVFVERAFPGSTVRASITGKKKDVYFARVLEVLVPSPEERDPFCVHEPYCGGCLWQRLDYGSQLEWKYRQVSESLRHLGGLEEVNILPIEASPKEIYYRNKMEFTFSDSRWFRPDEIADKSVQGLSRSCGLGLHVYSSYDKVFNLEECFLQSPESVEILKVVRDFCSRDSLPAYNIINHDGFWRFLVVKEGKNTGQRLVNIITAPCDIKGSQAVKDLARHLSAYDPDHKKITTFVHSVSDQKSQVATGNGMEVIWGDGSIQEKLLGRIYKISAASFFQTNPLGAEVLYNKILEYAGLTGKEEVWDLYCGAGSISILLASNARLVTGVEIVEEAVKDAYENAALNGVENCLFYAGDIKDVIKTLGSRRPSLVVSDPPRSGMNPRVIKALLEISPSKIIAVSCNPTTLARDLIPFLDRYRINRVHPFDLFPQTPHIECIVDMELKQ